MGYDDGDRGRPKTKVYAGQLAPKTLERDIDELFNRYGPIRRIEMKIGYAFVEYNDPRDAEDAIEKLNGFEFMGSVLTVEMSKGPRIQGVASGPPPNRSGGYRAVCDNLPPKANWQDLKDFARKSGNVTYADVWTDSRTEKKMGVIEFTTKEEMYYAIKDLDRKVLDGYEVALYEGEDDRIRGGGGRAPPGRGPPNRGGSPPRRGGGYDRGYDRGNDRGPPRDRPREEYRERDDYRDRGPPRGYRDDGFGRGPERYDRGPPPGRDGPGYRRGSPPRGGGGSPPRGGGGYKGGGRGRSPPPREMNGRERSPPPQRLRERRHAEREENRAREQEDDVERPRPNLTPSPGAST